MVVVHGKAGHGVIILGKKHPFASMSAISSAVRSALKSTGLNNHLSKHVQRKLATEVGKFMMYK